MINPISNRSLGKILPVNAVMNHNVDVTFGKANAVSSVIRPAAYLAGWNVKFTYNTKIQKLKGGRSRYKRLVSLIIDQKGNSTKIQKFQGRCPRYETSVLEIHKAYNTKMKKFQGGCSRYKLI